jgi:hypothetical protein
MASVPEQSSPTTRGREHAKVCILNESDARLLTYAGIEHKCSSRRHHHYSKSKVDALVKAGELVWLGKHRKFATFKNARSWMKVYVRNQHGETVSCGMQLVRGGGGF